MTATTPARQGNPEASLATFGERLAAVGFDVVVLTAVFLSVLVAMRALFDELGEVVAWTAASALPPVYYVVAHARWGKTIGKRMLRIEVTADAGPGIGWRRALRRESPWIVFALADLAFVVPEIARNFDPLRPSDGAVAFETIFFARLVLTLGSAMQILASPRRQALHDSLAGTIVLREGVSAAAARVPRARGCDRAPEPPPRT